MADRKQYYFRQKVTQGELNGGFDGLEAADRALMTDAALQGVQFNMEVTERGAGANISVDVAAGLAYDKLGQRLFVPSLQNVDCSVDKDNVSTTVTVGGQFRILSLFVNFARAESDPRTDGNGDTVNFEQEETFEFKIVQSAQGASPTPPTLDDEWILLADITRSFGQTEILDSDIDIDRREDMFVVDGTPRAIREGRLNDVIEELLTFYNNHVTDAADKHTATGLTATITATWADASGIAGATVDAAIEEIVTDLAGVSGANKIGAAIAATWRDSSTIVGATVDAVLEEIVTDLKAQATGDEGALRIGAFQRTSGSKTLSTGSVGSQILALLVLAANHFAGSADKHDGTAIVAEITSTWNDGTGIAGVNIDAAIEEIITDLGSETASSDGAGRIGYEGRTSPVRFDVAAGSVNEALDALIDEVDNIQNAGYLSLQFGNTLGPADATTRFLDPGFAVRACPSTEAKLSTDRSSSNGDVYLRSFAVLCRVRPVDDNIVLTVRRDGADIAATVTLTPGAGGQAVQHDVSIAFNDTRSVSVKVAAGASISSGGEDITAVLYFSTNPN